MGGGGGGERQRVFPQDKIFPQVITSLIFVATLIKSQEEVICFHWLYVAKERKNNEK